MARSAYAENLIRTVLDNSEADDWASAVQEWEIVDWDEDLELKSACICGKERLRYLYTIRNRYNGNILDPIGSSCIRKFERTDLNDEVSALEDMFRLLHAYENHEFIALDSRLFSRKLLLYLYEDGAFPGTTYNHGDGRRDYQFLLDMFNAHNDSISRAQQGKINAIIMNSIIPYLQRKLHATRY